MHIHSALDNNLEQKYDFVFSIGRSCHGAMMLGHLNLQGLYKPFDYLISFDGIEIVDRHYQSAFGVHVNLILTGFRSFLELDDLAILHPVVEDFMTLSVTNKRHKLHFLHDFPNGKTVAEFYETVKERYQRRIRRLYWDLCHSKRTLIVYLQDAWDQINQDISYIDDGDLILWNTLLNEKFLGPRIDFCLFEHSEEKAINEIQEIKIHENITRFRSNHKFTNQNDPRGAVRGSIGYPIVSIEKVLLEKVGHLAIPESEITLRRKSGLIF